MTVNDTEFTLSVCVFTGRYRDTVDATYRFLALCVDSLGLAKQQSSVTRDSCFSPSDLRAFCFPPMAFAPAGPSAHVADVVRMGVLALSWSQEEQSVFHQSTIFMWNFLSSCTEKYLTYITVEV